MTIAKIRSVKSNLQVKSGTYILVLESRIEVQVQIGKLAALNLRSGFYLYVGSAFGPGGVKARVTCHNSRSKRLHWHIDYLTKMLQPNEVWYSYDISRREHLWAGILSDTTNITTPMRQFGASDCQCESHLFYSGKLPSINGFRKKAHSAIPNHDRIMVERL